ncbi:MAG TPA: serpin family protein [Gemmatimonadales bacterium]|nr:serpin family protein [Gemmatimonadales bacterium]
MPSSRPHFALLLCAAACAGPTEQSGPPPLLPGLPRSLSSAEQRIVSAGNQFAFDLFRAVQRTQPGENLFLSPTSASMALGMTLNGAAGSTLDSMRVALAMAGAPIEEINAGYGSLIDLLRGLDSRVEFAIANSIWARQGMPFAPAFLEAGKTTFDAEIRAMDFAAPATLTTINQWVSDQTRGKIPTILDQIEPDNVMFLINAIYFKGAWRLAFDPAKTRSLPFQSADGTSRNVPTMLLDPEPLRHASAEGHEVVELLYGNGAFVMTLVLPAAGRSLTELTEGLDAARWAEWTGALAEHKLGLALPKFKLEYKRELKDDLSALGMRVAFDPDRADFSGMLGGPVAGNLYISKVIQKTFVDVNEEGTTAAAATSVGISVTSAPLTIQFDRPFLFAIRERHSGTILFLGQIAKL